MMAGNIHAQQINNAGPHSACSIFQKNYTGPGFNVGYAVAADTSGYVLAGTTTGSGQGGSDVLILKTDRDGNVLWSETIGGSKNDGAKAIKKTSDGGYILVGFTSSFVYAPVDTSNFYIIKINHSGAIQWTRAIGSNRAEYANDVIETYDNKYVVVGNTLSVGPGRWDIYLLELDATGNLLWSYGMGTTGNDYGNGVIQTSTHGFVLVGATSASTLTTTIPFLLETSELGVVQNPAYSFNLGTTVSSSQRYFSKIINGYFNDYAISGANGLGSVGDAQHFIMDVSTGITLNWMKSYSLNSGAATANSIMHSGGGFVLGGTMGIDHPALIRTDAIGQVLAAKFYPPVGNAYYGRGFDAVPTTDGGIVEVGLRYNSSDTSLYLIKADSVSLTTGCDEQNGFSTSAMTLSPVSALVTASAAIGSNYIAIDSGKVAVAYPFMNTICFAVGIEEHILVNEFKARLYPNPNQGLVTLEYTLPNAAEGVMVMYDVCGKEVRRYHLPAGEHKLELNEQTAGPGIYFCTYFCNGKPIGTPGKLVIVK